MRNFKHDMNKVERKKHKQERQRRKNRRSFEE